MGIDEKNMASMKRWIQIGLLASILPLVPGTALSQQRFPTTKPEDKIFVEEKDYYYTQSQYEPPVTLKPLAKEAAVYTTPEDTFIAQFSAMLAGDYDWWFSTFAEDAQKQIKANDEQNKQTPADWVARWKRAQSELQFTLLERKVSGPYAIIVYRAGVTPQNTIKFSAVFKRENGKWLATQDMQDDGLAKYSMEDKDKVVLPIRQPAPPATPRLLIPAKPPQATPSKQAPGKPGTATPSTAKPSNSTDSTVKPQ